MQGLYISFYKIQMSKPLDIISPIITSTPSKIELCRRKYWIIPEHVNFATTKSYSWIKFFFHFVSQRIAYNTVESVRNLQMFQTNNLPPPLGFMIEASDSIETSVNFNRTQRHCIPEDKSIHSPPYNNCKMALMSRLRQVTPYTTSWIRNFNYVA